jgi:hypothetical protein
MAAVAHSAPNESRLIGANGGFMAGNSEFVAVFLARSSLLVVILGLFQKENDCPSIARRANS